MQRESENGELLLGCLLYVAGSAIQYVSPAYLVDLGTRFGINEAQMGSVSAAENIGIGFASLLALWWNGRLDRKLLARVAVISCVIGDAASFFCRDFHLLIALRCATATLGEGTLFILAFVVIGQTRNPDRLLGMGLSAVVLFTSAVLSAAGPINRTPIGSGWLIPMAAVALLVLPALRWMPDGFVPPARIARRLVGANANWLAVIAVVGMGIWSAAPGAFWTFADAAATTRNLSDGEIGAALAVGNAVGLLGSAIAAWQGNRWKRVWPTAIGTVCLCLSVAAFQMTTHVAALTATLAAFNIFWNYAIVYQMALVLSLDRTGKATAGISAAQMIGFAGGGFLSGFAIVARGFSVLTVIVAAFAVMGLLVLMIGFRRDTGALAEAT